MFSSSVYQRRGFLPAFFHGIVATRPESTAFRQVKQVRRRAGDGFKLLFSEFDVWN
jgi:hypothetical protein